MIPHYTIIYIYKKDNDFKVLTMNHQTIEHDRLKDSGYVHLHTLNAAAFVDYILKLDNEQLVTYINHLKDDYNNCNTKND